jgi:Skp family chaperone for outer membrane proteins
MKNRFKNIAAMAVVIAISGSSSAATRDAKVESKEILDIAFVDSFQAMRECEDGQRVGKELDTMRDKLSKEIQNEAIRITKEETDLKSKAATLKSDVLAQNERKIAKQKRDLEEKVRESEEAIKVAMQQKTEELAVKIEEGIVEVAKARGVDAVIDKMTGRVMYTKDNHKGDITTDAIAYVDKKSSTVAKSATIPKTATTTA